MVRTPGRMSSRKAIAGRDHAPAEEHDIGVDRVHEGDGSDRQVMRPSRASSRTASGSPAAAASAIARLVSSCGSIARRRAGRCRSDQSFIVRLYERRGRGITLEMPEGAARTAAAIIRLDDDMAALAAVAVAPLDDRAVRPRFHRRFRSPA